MWFRTMGNSPSFGLIAQGQIKQFNKQCNTPSLTLKLPQQFPIPISIPLLGTKTFDIPVPAALRNLKDLENIQRVASQEQKGKPVFFHPYRGELFLVSEKDLEKTPQQLNVAIDNQKTFNVYSA